MEAMFIGLNSEDEVLDATDEVEQEEGEMVDDPLLLLLLFVWFSFFD